MNKCTEDDEIEDVIDYYMEAKSQAEATNLPDLAIDDNSVLLICRKNGVKKNMKDEALKAA